MNEYSSYPAVEPVNFGRLDVNVNSEAASCVVFSIISVTLIRSLGFASSGTDSSETIEIARRCTAALLSFACTTVSSLTD